MQKIKSIVKTDNNESTSVATNNLFKFRQLSTNDPIGLAKTIPGTNKKNEYKQVSSHFYPLIISHLVAVIFFPLPDNFQLFFGAETGDVESCGAGSV